VCVSPLKSQNGVLQSADLTGSKNLKSYQSSSGQENGMIQCYKGASSSKGVSFFYQPTRHERGSYIQFCNAGCIFLLISRGQFHERSVPHVRLIKFSIINISVTVGPSSILSLICDHDIFHVKCIYDAGGLVFEKSYQICDHDVFCVQFKLILKGQCHELHKCAVEHDLSCKNFNGANSLFFVLNPTYGHVSLFFIEVKGNTFSFENYNYNLTRPYKTQTFMFLKRSIS
jgi:hypothetical protein